MHENIILNNIMIFSRKDKGQYRKVISDNFHEKMTFVRGEKMKALRVKDCEEHRVLNFENQFCKVYQSRKCSFLYIN